MDIPPTSVFLQISILPNRTDTFPYQFYPAIFHKLCHILATPIRSKAINSNSIDLHKLTNFLGCSLKNCVDIERFSNLSYHFKQYPLLLGGQLQIDRLLPRFSEQICLF